MGVFISIFCSFSPLLFCGFCVCFCCCCRFVVVLVQFCLLFFSRFAVAAVAVLLVVLMVTKAVNESMQHTSRGVVTRMEK